MYISLNFHDASVTKQNFREGFAYKMFFRIKKKDAGEGACTGDVEFILKVVPEFVTWNGNAGTASQNHGIAGDIYDCEKFYSNICNQIYFKPEAELVNQQHLTYNKAWVESCV